MVIGITGKYGAGKSYLARYIQAKLQDMHFTILHVDKIGHLALAHHAKLIIATFGKSIVTTTDTSTQGSSNAHLTINRKALGAIVFNDAEKLSQLEAIVHPWMKEHIANIVNDCTRNYIIDAALLHHLSLDSLCSATLIVHSTWITRLMRSLFRDKLPVRAIIQRFTNQSRVPDKHYLRKNATIRKIALNSTTNSTDLLVNGTYSSKHLDTIISKIVHGEHNATTKHATRQ